MTPAAPIARRFRCRWCVTDSVVLTTTNERLGPTEFAALRAHLQRVHGASALAPPDDFRSLRGHFTVVRWP